MTKELMNMSKRKILEDAANSVVRNVRCQTHTEANGKQSVVEHLLKLADAEPLPDSALVRTEGVLSEVMEERVRQFGLWGDQRFPFHHPMDGDGERLIDIPYADLAQDLKDECDMRRSLTQRGGEDQRSNALVLLEEVFEALAETDPAKIRIELIQVAAVAVKIVELIDSEAADAQ